MSAQTGSEVIERMINNIERDPGKTSFQERFLRFAESDIYSDCQFIVGPEKTIIKGHKLIYCAASEVFEAMFYGPLKEDMSVDIDDLSAEGFQGMKTFIYSGEISFKSAIHALFTFTAARKYLVTHLVKVCRKFIEEKLQVSDVLEFCDICFHNRITEFEELCLKIIQEKTDEVVDSEYFILAKSDTIELMLKSPALKLTSEIELFNHFERWALAEAERRQFSSSEIATSFNHLKKHFRFLTINGDDFSRVMESVLLTQEEKQAIAFDKIKLLSKTRSDTSLVQHPRKYNLLSSEYHKCCRKFVVSLDTVKGPNIIYDIMTIEGISPNHNSLFKIHFDPQFGFMCCRLEIIYSCVKAMFIIKSKFRVPGKDKCDDLEFENEYRDMVNAPVSSLQRTIYPTVIPMTKLKSSHFLKTLTGHAVIAIEVEFKIKKINL